MRIALLVVVGLAAVACGGSGSDVGLDVTGDDLGGGVDFGPLPDVPDWHFELVEDFGGHDTGSKPDGWVPPDIDGYVFEVLDGGSDDLVGPLPDGGCRPDCKREDGTVRECGPDRCGSICGYCGYGEQCVVDECKPQCIPDCKDKDCGPDGCYGTCPPGCEANFSCNDQGKCIPDCDHDANCVGRQCGSDKCGGTCGSCGLGYVCEEVSGQCEPDPCTGIPLDTGKCSGDTLQQCVNGELIETPCPSIGPDFHCVWNAPAYEFQCVEGCLPQCTKGDGSPKECGANGCGGQCGTCPAGWSCQDEICHPAAGGACGWLTAAGACFENVLWFCGSGTLFNQDCTVLSATCKYDTASAMFKCK